MGLGYNFVRYGTHVQLFTRILHYCFGVSTDELELILKFKHDHKFDTFNYICRLFFEPMQAQKECTIFQFIN